MAFLLRKIRKSRWYKTDKTAWMLENDLQADALNDLATQDNSFSVYYIDENQSNIDRVIAALAANTDGASNIDFALFDEKIINDLGIEIKKSEGKLPDDIVNIWHRDAHELSASKLYNLAMKIKEKAIIDRKNPQKILTIVANSVLNNQINRSRVKWKSIDDLNKLDLLIAKKLE